ncbi:MAG: hypothetical protein JST90_14745 [Bacteroidetes bacterium]|nr:hypothetical protein [Bacteroidota bacterium]
MDLKTLKENLALYNVPERWYSIDDGLKPGACIIYKNYAIWECFYLDEKGNRNMYSVCKTDEDAYDWLWDKMKMNLKYRKSPPKR